MNAAVAKKAAVLMLAAAVALVALWPALDTPAGRYVDAGLQRALTAFATARALNAAISVAQGTEVGASLGAQLTLSVGEVLDPLNDLVENFSNLMLMASVAFALQKVLLVIGQDAAIKFALGGVLLAWSLTWWFAGRAPRWLGQLLLVLLMVRFAVPLASLGSEAVYTHFLSQDYETSQAAISGAAQNGAATAGLWETLKDFDPVQRFEQLKQVVGNATDQLIKLIVVFMLQTLVVPGVMLWLVYGTLRAALTSAVAS